MKHPFDPSKALKSLCAPLNPAELQSPAVGRYEELAEKFREAMEQELDLEQVLKRTLEYVLEHVGPTNAVVFLPSRAGAYTVGGYVNYSMDKTKIDTMLGRLADTAAARIAESPSPLHIMDNMEMVYRLDDQAGWLTGRHAAGFSCRDRGQVLAALLLFRGPGEPFAPAAIGRVAVICPILARHLVKVVNIHHRMNDNAAFEHGPDPDEMVF